MASSIDPQGTMGRYGVLHYVKKNEPAVVASYPIDIETVKLGRDVHCDIRMWYDWVSHLHCKVIFDDGKAFLEVLGGNGVVVDGSSFFPNSSGPPTIVPLTNGSEFEIHNRRFIFQYPPKEQRAMLLATPRPKSRKSLRLSMINSAVVFTPGPSTSAEENWTKLQTPVKPFQTEASEEEVTVVAGDQARVLQFDKDLIVLEEVEAAPEPVKPRQSLPFPPTTPLHGRNQRFQPSTTPRRRLQLSLHKAVLVRNSQRALIEAEEESEVLEAVSPERMPTVDDEDEDEEMAEEEEDAEADDEPASPTPAAPTGIRASLSAIGNMLPFMRGRSTSPTKDVAEVQPAASELVEDEQFADQESDTDEETEQLPPNQALGNFMTPQAKRHTLPDPRFSVDSKPSDSSGLDLEAAKRRLSHLGRAQRPIRPVAQLHDESKQPAAVATPERPALSAEDKVAAAARRLSLLEPEPELPHPSNRRQSLLATPRAVRTTEDPSSPVKSAEERLAELQRTVDSVTQRDSVRESRRSFVSKDIFPFLPSTSETGAIEEETSSQLDHAEKRDEDVEMKDIVEESTPAASARSAKRPAPTIPATPSFKGMRDLFKAEEPTKQGVSTPSLTGVRSLFRPAPSFTTPSFGGIRDMFRSPAAPTTPLYSGVADMPEDPAAGREDLSATESQDEVSAMLSPDQLPSTAAGIAIDNFNFGRLSPMGLVSETFDHTDIVGLDSRSGATEIVAHSEVAEVAAPKTSRAKTSTSKTKKTEIPAESTSRSSRKRDDTGPSEVQHMEVEAPEPARPSRRGVKAVATTEDAEVPKARKAKAVDESPAAPTKARRPARGEDVAEEPMADVEPQLPAASSARAKLTATRAKKGKATAEEPVQALEVAEAEPVGEETSAARKRTTKKPAEDVVATEVPAKPKARTARTKAAEQAEAPATAKPRATRTKATTETKTKAAPAEIVEDVEMITEEEAKPVVKRTAVRPTKAAAAVKTKAVKEEVEMPSTVIPRTTKKAVGGKKATTTVVDDVEDKENSAEPPMEEQPTTGRSRATARTTRKTVKTEVVDEPVPRATRTRARK